MFKLNSRNQEAYVIHTRFGVGRVVAVDADKEGGLDDKIDSLRIQCRFESGYRWVPASEVIVRGRNALSLARA